MAVGNSGPQELAPQHHVARYCRGRDLDERGRVRDSAFLLRDGEEYVSTNWLEPFHPADRGIQIAGVRQTLLDKGRRVARSGHFIVLNVGASVALCQNRLNLAVQFINLGEAHDLSHTGIYGLAADKARAAQVLAQSISPAEVYPAGQP